MPGPTPRHSALPTHPSMRPPTERAAAPAVPAAQSQMDKWIRSSISELDVSTWDRATPSYVLLPANYPRLK